MRCGIPFDKSKPRSEEEVVFKNAIVGGPPKQLKLTANKIAGVEFHLDGTGIVDILGDESIIQKKTTKTSTFEIQSQRLRWLNINFAPGNRQPVKELE